MQTAQMDDLEQLRLGYATLGRLELLLQLGAPTQVEKERHAAAAFLYVEAAVRLQAILKTRLHRRSPNLQWPSSLSVGSLIGLEGTVSTQATDVHNRLTEHLRSVSGRFCASAGSFEMTTPLAEAVEGLPLGTSNTASDFVLVGGLQDAGVRQALKGPRAVHLDPVFERAQSVLDRRHPAFEPSDPGAAEHYWCLSAQETLAADLCALCAVEYDGLPLAFYYDMAFQAWDESRHAVCYLRLGIELLEAARSTYAADHPVLLAAAPFFSTGRGLPVALEGNFYEAIYNCDLVQRLVLMQHDSEAPGIRPKRRLLRTPFVTERPLLRDVLFFDMHDEMNHARIGATWLRHLLPDRDTRRAAIEETRLLRGFFLLTSIAQYSGHDIGAVGDAIISGSARHPVLH
jgi:hypothetical protein